jgi:voltage-gated potassium channel Kch
VANSADVEERPWILRFLRGLTLKRAILGIAAVTMVVTLGSALVMRVVEHKTYTSFGEACWWAIQTVTTTGYGDNPPVTVGGRISRVLALSRRTPSPVTATMSSIRTPNRPAR